jgi:hypothetical protein
MAVSRVKKVIEEIKKFTATEKIEFFRSLITEGILDIRMNSMKKR